MSETKSRAEMKHFAEMDHFGLFFGAAERDLARAQRAVAPLATAWPALERPPATGTPALPEPRDSLHALALWGGLRFRFTGDEEAAARSRAIVRNLVKEPMPREYPRAAGQLLAQAQILELLRPTLGEDEGASLRGAWRDSWQGLASPWEYDEQAWSRLLQLVAGVLLEEAGHIEAAVAAYREAIAGDLHPEGYWRPVVGEEMGAAPPGSYLRQLRTTQAYALLAEAAEQLLRAGLAGFPSLWTTHKRHVSIRTAVAYCAYYYFYPEHWRWEAQPLRETAPYFRQHGAFMELAQRRVPTRPLPLLLHELRPLVDVYGGGWTTLTHGAAAAPAARIWDGRKWLARLRRAFVRE